MTSRAGVLALLGACVLATGCGGGIPSSSGSPTGIVVVTSAGSALGDGSDDVTPTLDLRVSAARALDPGEVAARLDGTALQVREAGGAVAATTSPMALGSAHHLDLDVAGATRRIGFRVVAPTAAMAALHHDGRDGTVLDLAFSLAPPRTAVEAALPRGGAPSWLDDRHLRAAWPSAPAGTLRLPATMATARGSHLAGSIVLDLWPVGPGSLRAAMVPAPPSGVAGSPLVVGFSVATPASRAAVAAHAEQLSLDSPTGVTVGGDGSLAGAPDVATVAAAAAHGLPLWPLIQNRGFDSATVDTLLHEPVAVARFAAGAAALARDGGFPGLHLDVENVPPDDKDLLTALVTRLAAALHADGRRLAVAVVPHKPDHLNYYSGAYDLTAIGRAADLVTVMAYEQHGASTGPGAVAGVDWVATVLDGTVQSVGAARSLLGLPVYSRSWGPGGDIADSFPSSVASALEAPGARVDADFTAGALLVHGADGTYTALVDAPAVLTLAAQVKRRGMAGVALWRLGLEDPALWAALPARAPRL